MLGGKHNFLAPFFNIGVSESVNPLIAVSCNYGLVLFCVCNAMDSLALSTQAMTTHWLGLESLAETRYEWFAA